MDISQLKRVGEAVANRLFYDLKSGRIEKLGRDELEPACKQAFVKISDFELEDVIKFACEKVTYLSMNDSKQCSKKE